VVDERPQPVEPEPALEYPPLVPSFGSEAITPQTRSGFPCYGAALASCVEATRHDDAEKNRLCPPSPYGRLDGRLGEDDRPAHPNGADLLGPRGTQPGRIPPGHPRSAALDDARARAATHTRGGLARLAELT
jgi:hypothetical protein